MRACSKPGLHTGPKAGSQDKTGKIKTGEKHRTKPIRTMRKAAAMLTWRVPDHKFTIVPARASLQPKTRFYSIRCIFPCRVRDWKKRFDPTDNEKGALLGFGEHVLFSQKSLKKP